MSAYSAGHDFTLVQRIIIRRTIMIIMMIMIIA